MKNKRIIAAVLAALMLITAMPLSMSAVETDDIVIPDDYKNLDTGDNDASEIVCHDVPGVGSTVYIYYVRTHATYGDILGVGIKAIAQPESNIVIPSTLDGYPVLAVGSNDNSQPIFYDVDIQKVQSVEFPNSIIAIERYSFSGCQLKSLVVPPNVFRIGKEAFMGCPLESITFNNNRVWIIEGNAFSYNDKLTSVVIPDSVTTLEPSAFKNCTNLSTIDISENSKLKYIYSEVFDGTAFYNNPDNWTDNALYLGNNLLKVKCDANTKELNVREGTKVIAWYAFVPINDTVTETVTLPKSIIFLGNQAINVSSNTKVFYNGSKKMWDENVIKYTLTSSWCGNLTPLLICNGDLD